MASKKGDGGKVIPYGRKIFARDVKIEVAEVRIDHMMISNRQVTQSIFRQLTREELVDAEAMKLNGVPWGRVNYFWRGCDGSNSRYDEENHTHVVWQKGDSTASLLHQCLLG
jgi:hypothetical protein